MAAKKRVSLPESLHFADIFKAGSGALPASPPKKVSNNERKQKSRERASDN